MNAIELLKADHQKVKGLFEQVKATDDLGAKEKLFVEIDAELTVHTHIEEVAFYPYLLEKGDKELQDITKEGIEEHHGVKIFLREIAALVKDSDKLEPKMKVLMESVEHHVEEEEGEMFKMCEKQFDKDALEELGAAMEAERTNFKKQAAAA